jgi:ribulose-5-phosphate 4-epimerase/fuculose-1-phosphate aldolase
VTLTDRPASTPLPAAAADTDAMGRQLRMATPPVFASVEEERAHRKATLAAAFRMFSKAGLDEGVAGHITVRDPEAPDTFWVNPFGMHFAMIRSSDLVRVDHAGEVVEGDRAVNGAAVAIHCAVHAARPDVLAAAHAHGPYGKTLSCLDMTMEPLTQFAGWFQVQPIRERISRDQSDLFD